jgi:hypothetical protein
LRTNSLIVQKEQEFGEGPVMEIMVNIPMVSYEDMLKRCDPSRPEYELLKNGLVMRNQEGHQEVRVLTDEDGAKQITDFAARACPEVLPSVAVISEPVKSVSQPGGWVFKGARL